MSKISYPVTFNGIDLASVSGVTVLSARPYHPPKRNVSLSYIVRTNKSKVNSGFYTGRTISVRLEISRSTRALAEQSLDALMAILQAQNKALVFVQSSVQRKYFATYSDYVMNVEGGSYIDIELIFTCSDTFGYDLGATTLLNISSPFTSSSRSDALNFPGSAEWQTPVISITFSAISGGSNKSVIIGNGNTGQQITINRTWLAGDMIEIDCFNETVRVNNTDVSFTGAIPKWNNGIGYWYYSDNFSTRTFTGSILVVNRYV
jgi:phage-related protein